LLMLKTLPPSALFTLYHKNTCFHVVCGCQERLTYTFIAHFLLDTILLSLMSSALLNCNLCWGNAQTRNLYLQGGLLTIFLVVWRHEVKLGFKQEPKVHQACQAKRSSLWFIMYIYMYSIRQVILLV